MHLILLLFDLGHYQHFTSAQAWHEKTAVVHTLTLSLSAHNYCSTQQLLAKELKHITEAFKSILREWFSSEIYSATD